MDRLAAMRAFVAVAAQGSFSEAARRLRLSPSVVTRQIAQLEDELGLLLLNRTTRSVRLTERGQIHLQSCHQILDDLDAAERKVRGEDARPRGEMSVTAPITFGRLHVLPIITKILREHADLSIRLTLSDRSIHLVEEGIDIAVRIGELADSSLVAVKLGQVSRVVAASPAYLASRAPPRVPADLADHDLVVFEGLDVASEWRFGDGGLVVRVAPRLAVNSADAAIVAAEAGLGITRAISYQVREAVIAGRLVPILQDFAPPPLPVSAVHPQRRIGSANVAAFVKAAREHFRAHPLGPLPTA